jgi:predicted RND superfamily exporter protein
MMPLAMGWGADPSFRSPMAIAVIGGLITSTLLSLLVVPAVFTYIDDLEHLLKRGMQYVRRDKDKNKGAARRTPAVDLSK